MTGAQEVTERGNKNWGWRQSCEDKEADDKVKKDGWCKIMKGFVYKFLIAKTMGKLSRNGFGGRMGYVRQAKRSEIAVTDYSCK